MQKLMVQEKLLPSGYNNLTAGCIAVCSLVSIESEPPRVSWRVFYL
ncbi:hypothetical protein AD08_4969 [Escherichia coli 1-110-08_S4_C2]|nr:hypothetical protein AD08_4969 [Escherichia coli 1-110-08_S4_C2]EZJ32384.1 hypothetical protein AD38_5274 [Escherichia coli 1-176-05_S4_C3]EZJ64384.1 hypothetical protein AC81_5029 [Escherichia coli 1-176-05_S4_C1]KDT57975.1 hypothetical protein AC05_4810 [Escherichia coli 3-267-03_S3_C1]